MKKLITVFLITIVPIAGFSQSLFDKYEDMDKVGAVVVNKSMINLLVQMGANEKDPEAQEFISLAKELDGLKVFITEDKGVSADMKTSVDKYLKSSSLEELMRVKDDDTHVKFYIKNGKDEDHVRELLMFVTGIKNTHVAVNDRKFETVLLSLTGDIDLTKIGALTKKMNLPEELNKVKKDE